MQSSAISPQPAILAHLDQRQRPLLPQRLESAQEPLMPGVPYVVTAAQASSMSHVEQGYTVLHPLRQDAEGKRRAEQSRARAFPLPAANLCRTCSRNAGFSTQPLHWRVGPSSPVPGA